MLCSASTGGWQWQGGGGCGDRRVHSKGISQERVVHKERAGFRESHGAPWSSLGLGRDWSWERAAAVEWPSGRSRGLGKGHSRANPQPSMVWPRELTPWLPPLSALPVPRRWRPRPLHLRECTCGMGVGPAGTRRESQGAARPHHQAHYLTALISFQS